MSRTPPPRPPYEVARIADIPPTATSESLGLVLPGEWRQVRHHFGIREFSVNAFVATEPGQQIVHEHSERANDDPDRAGDEELYYVAAGRALVRLGDEELEVGSGAFVFVGEPALVRSFTALERGTTVLAIGTNPGVEFTVSRFEQEASPPPRWSRPR